MPPEATGRGKLSNSYELFILLLTLLSLLDMVALLLPRLAPATVTLLEIYDFACASCSSSTSACACSGPRRSASTSSTSAAGSTCSVRSPALGLFRVTSLLRLARLSRLFRVLRQFRSEGGSGLAKDVLANRGQYAAFITLVLAMTVITVTSVLMVQTESRVAGSNITTGGDAIWWAIVTITTVGYGDQYPVTAVGRVLGAFVMFAGVGIIGALASILASVLIPAPEKQADPTAEIGELKDELAGVREELSAIRALLAAGDADR